jgi:hypothetical protein
MTNIYNKGRYRSGEWAKHLRPFLKTIGNRRWRRTASNLKDLDLVLDNETIDLKTRSKSKKTIEVKFRLMSIGDKTYSYRAKYRNMRAANDAMKRHNVIEAKIIK